MGQSKSFKDFFYDYACGLKLKLVLTIDCVQKMDVMCFCCHLTQVRYGEKKPLQACWVVCPLFDSNGRCHKVSIWMFKVASGSVDSSV